MNGLGDLRAGLALRSLRRPQPGVGHCMSIDDIRADFALLDEGRPYRYVIALGGALHPCRCPAHGQANKVRGCASQVWLASSVHAIGAGTPPVSSSRATATRYRTRLIAVLFALLDGKTAENSAHRRWRRFRRPVLKEHLTPQRSNGFFSMVERIRADARALAAVGATRPSSNCSKTLVPGRQLKVQPAPSVCWGTRISQSKSCRF